MSTRVELESGSHAIGIKGWDLGQVISAAIVHFEISNGSTWVSDASWRYDPTPAAADSTREGWCEASFDDSSWDLVLDIGPIGIAPWAGAPVDASVASSVASLSPGAPVVAGPTYPAPWSAALTGASKGTAASSRATSAQNCSPHSWFVAADPFSDR